MKSDTLSKTANEKIFVEQQENIPKERIMAGLEGLDRAVSGEGNRENLVALMKQLVPTYRDPEEVNCAVVSETDTEEDEPRFAAAELAGVGELS